MTPRPMRTFESGATRDSSDDKPDFEGYFSPLVLERRAQYMQKHSVQNDGTHRDSDNWQKGMGLDVFMKSAWRHFFHWWQCHRGVSGETVMDSDEEIEDAICALMFNAEGYLHEHLSMRR